MREFGGSSIQAERGAPMAIGVRSEPGFYAENAKTVDEV
jgi:hypothetical protein